MNEKVERGRSGKGACENAEMREATLECTDFEGEKRAGYCTYDTMIQGLGEIDN